MAKGDPSIKPFSQWIEEDAPANSAGGGGVAGIGIGPQGEPGVDLRKKRKKDGDDPLVEAADITRDGDDKNYRLIVNGQSVGRIQRRKRQNPDRVGGATYETVWEAKPGPFAMSSGFSTQQEAEQWLIGQAGLTEEVAPMPDDNFAGASVFTTGMDEVMKSRNGKLRYHRYSRYVGESDKGEQIRQHGRSTKNDIVLKDEKTGVMTYLRRKQVK